jgi:hypothetical protein
MPPFVHLRTAFLSGQCLRRLARPHTYHRDDAAHERTRRYEGLRAKAAGTNYPHDADACHAKAEQLRDK